jgi:hypothetical protein
MPDILYPVEELLRQSRKLEDYLESQGGTSTGAHFPPSEEPLEWTELRGKVVRLDVAIMALHLLAARVAFRSIPGLIRQQLLKTAVNVGKAAGKLTVFLALKRLSVIVGLALDIGDAFNRIRMEEDQERAIRRGSIVTKRDLRTKFLKPKRGVQRHRANVYTRNPGPKQRKANQP